MANHNAASSADEHYEEGQQKGVEAARTERPQHNPKRQPERGGNDQTHARVSLCNRTAERRRELADKPPDLAGGVI
jgi:hypothetical protein